MPQHQVHVRNNHAQMRMVINNLFPCGDTEKRLQNTEMGLALVQQSLQQSLQTNAEALSRIESGIKELKGEIKEELNEVKKKMETDKGEIKGEINDVKNKMETSKGELKAEINEIRNKMETSNERIANLRLYIVVGLSFAALGEKAFDKLITLFSKT